MSAGENLSITSAIRLKETSFYSSMLNCQSGVLILKFHICNSSAAGFFQFQLVSVINSTSNRTVNNFLFILHKLQTVLVAIKIFLIEDII